jgi:hypothetical protein
MTRPTRLVLPALLLLVLAGCAGTHPAPRYAWDPKADFAPLKSYAWYDGPGFQMPHGDSIIDGRFIDERVRTAVDRTLEGKGFRKVDAAKADMLVSYRTGDAGVADQEEVEGYDWWTGYVVGVKYEKERSVRINIRKPPNILVWRGEITRPEGTIPDAVGRELDREIGTLLSHFPPAPGAVPSKP